MTNQPILTLYTRVGCHLCDEMIQQLEHFQQQYDFALNMIDIDTDSHLKRRYGERVPVLAASEREICHYYLNKDILLSVISAH